MLWRQGIQATFPIYNAAVWMSEKAMSHGDIKEVEKGMLTSLLLEDFVGYLTLPEQVLFSGESDKIEHQNE